jgi:hypothetical protein
MATPSDCPLTYYTGLTRRTRDNPSGAELIEDGIDDSHSPRPVTHNLLPSATEATPRSKKNVAEVRYDPHNRHGKQQHQANLLFRPSFAMGNHPSSPALGYLSKSHTYSRTALESTRMHPTTASLISTRCSSCSLAMIVLLASAPIY